MSVSIPSPLDLAPLSVSNLPTPMGADTPDDDEENMLSGPQSAIHDIPPEILIQICSYNTYRDWTPCSASPYSYTSAEPKLPPAILNTIHASHVCHRWRNILISAPELWANMVDPHSVGMEVILERSRPLGITLVPPPWGDPKTEEDFEIEMDSKEVQERLIEYHFTQDADGRKLSRLEGLDHLNFPRLRFLYLELCPSQKLPKQFPGLSTPALRHLYLRGIFPKKVERLDAISSTLTHLTIVNLHQVDKIPVPTLVTIINRLPKLQSVTLCEALAPKKRATNPTVLEMICVPNFSITDETEMVSLFFECAELTPPFNKVSLHCNKLGNKLRMLDHIVSKAIGIFGAFCSDGAFERYRLHIGPGEITYVTLLDPCPLDGQPEEPRFHFHISLMEFPSFNFDRLISTFLPAWLYNRVEDLTIPLPVFNLLLLELGEEIVVEMLRRFSNVRVLGGVGHALWDLLYRRSQPLDDDERLILPSLHKIGFHRDCLPTTLEVDDDVCDSVSGGISQEVEEGTEEVDGRLTIAVLHPSEELLPESDSEDGSFVYDSGLSDYSDFDDSTEFSEPSKLAASYPRHGGTAVKYPAPYYLDECTDIREEYISSREILEFCYNRPAIRSIVISSPGAADDQDCEVLRLALAEAGVALEVVTVSEEQTV